METQQIVIIAVVSIILLVLVIWFIRRLRSRSPSNYNIAHLIEGQQDGTQYMVVDKNKIPLSAQGNEFSISLWVFIKDYNYRYGSRKVLLYRGDKENVESNPYIYFEPKNNDLTVRVQLQSGTGKRFPKEKNNRNDNRNENHNNKSEKFSSLPLEYFNELKSNISGNIVEGFDPTPTSGPATIGDVTSRLDRIELQMQKLSMVNPAGPTPVPTSTNILDESEQDIMYDECTIENIPIQKWVHLVVSVYNNNIEIYMDGKLHKTCNLSGFAKPNTYNMHVTPNGGFNGFIAQLDYSTAALPIDKIYNIYISGPKLEKGIMDKISQFGSGVKNVVS